MVTGKIISMTSKIIVVGWKVWVLVLTTLWESSRNFFNFSDQIKKSRVTKLGRCLYLLYPKIAENYPSSLSLDSDSGNHADFFSPIVTLILSMISITACYVFLYLIVFLYKASFAKQPFFPQLVAPIKKLLEIMDFRITRKKICFT